MLAAKCKLPGNSIGSTLKGGVDAACSSDFEWFARCLSFVGWNRNASKEEKNGHTIIFSLPDGRKLTREELQGTTGRLYAREGKLLEVTGTVRYEIIGKGKVPSEAESLHQRAREAGGRGEYKKAIALLELASELAPDWPYPVYDRAFTHLLMNDFDGARTYYRKTVELSPRGFFTAITALDTLVREQNGELPVGTYLRYVSLEWMADSAKREQAVREMVKMIPQFAPAWKEFASLCDDDGERLAAIESGLVANPDRGTKGMLEINKALVLNLRGKHDEAVRLLGELALDPHSPLGTEHSAKTALAFLVSK
jgi:tetratricopeptide (TPR) repeat protein